MKRNEIWSVGSNECIPFFHSNSKRTEEEIISMLAFLVDKIFVDFAGKVFQQTVGIPIVTNCAPSQADIFQYS